MIGFNRTKMSMAFGCLLVAGPQLVWSQTAAVDEVIVTARKRSEPITYWITLDETATLPGISRKYEQIRYGLRGQIPDGLLFRVSSINNDEQASFKLQEQW